MDVLAHICGVLYTRVGWEASTWAVGQSRYGEYVVCFTSNAKHRATCVARGRDYYVKVLS